jgi:hypothetical protein
MSMNLSFRTNGLVCAAALLLLCAVGATPVPKAVPAAIRSGSPLPAPVGIHNDILRGAVPVNPHLRLPTPPPKPPAVAPKPAAAPEKKPGATTAPVKTASGVMAVPVWDAHAYITLHSGLGTIRGEILNAAGQPQFNVRVALRKPGGRFFLKVARRHITHTAPDGSFLMTNVQVGDYRVFASLGNKKAFVREAVNAGEVASVLIKI